MSSPLRGHSDVVTALEVWANLGGGGERIRHSRSPSVIEGSGGQPEVLETVLKTSPSKIVPGVKALAVKPGNFSSGSL